MSRTVRIPPHHEPIPAIIFAIVGGTLYFSPLFDGIIVLYPHSWRRFEYFFTYGMPLLLMAPAGLFIIDTVINITGFDQEHIEPKKVKNKENQQHRQCSVCGSRGGGMDNGASSHRSSQKTQSSCGACIRLEAIASAECVSEISFNCGECPQSSDVKACLDVVYVVANACGCWYLYALLIAVYSRLDECTPIEPAQFCFTALTGAFVGYYCRCMSPVVGSDADCVDEGNAVGTFLSSIRSNVDVSVDAPCRFKSLEGIKRSVECNLSPEHIIVFPTELKSLPTIPEELVVLEGNNQNLVPRIIHEVYWGTVVEEAPLLSPVLSGEKLACENKKARGREWSLAVHPYYRQTLTGHIIGLLELFLKGFVRGVVYSDTFLLNWHKDKNRDPLHLKANIIDISGEMKRAGLFLGIAEYVSLVELLNAGRDQGEEGSENDKSIATFRIIGALEHVLLDGNMITPSVKLQGEHDLEPSALTKAMMQRSGSEGVESRNAFAEKAENTQRMQDLIETLMPKIPLFQTYLELFKVVTFATHYVTTLREMGLRPAALSQAGRPGLITPFPEAFPPMAVKTIAETPVNIRYGDILSLLSKKKFNKHFHDMLENREVSFDALEERIADACHAVVQDKVAPHILDPDDDGYSGGLLARIQKSLVAGIVPLFQHSIDADRKALLEYVEGLKIEDVRSGALLLRDMKPTMSISSQHELFRKRFPKVVDALKSKQVEKVGSARREVPHFAFSGFDTDVAGEVDVQSLIDSLHNEDIRREQIQIEKRFTTYKENVLRGVDDMLPKHTKLLTRMLASEQLMNHVVIENVVLPSVTIEENHEHDRVVVECSVNANATPSALRKALSRDFSRRIQQTLTAIDSSNETLVGGHLLASVQLDRTLTNTNAHQLSGNPFEGNPQQQQHPPTQRDLERIVETDDIEMLQRVFDNHPIACKFFINEVSIASGVPVLYLAVSRGCLSTTTLLLHKMNADVNWTHPSGLTPLLVATRSGFSDISLQLLTISSIDVHVKLDDGMTPLHFAVHYEMAAVARRLSQLGVRAHPGLYQTRREGFSPMAYACSRGAMSILPILGTLNLSVTVPSTGDTLLHLCAGAPKESAACVEWLLQHFDVSFISSINERKETPLHVALTARNDDAAVLMMKRMEKSEALEVINNKFDENGYSAVDIALKYNCEPFIMHAAQLDDAIPAKLLKYKQPKNPTLENATNVTNDLAPLRMNRKALKWQEAVQSAIVRQCAPDVSRLLKQQDGEIKPQTLEVFVRSCIASGSGEMLDLVARSVPDISAVRFEDGRKLPHIICEAGQHDWISRVSRWNFSFDEEDNTAQKRTPISLVIDADDAKTLRAILEATTEKHVDAEPSSPRSNPPLSPLYQHALQLALESRKSDCIKLLVELRHFPFLAAGRSISVPVSGKYLCSSATITADDVNLAGEVGVVFEDEDLLCAAQTSSADTLTAIMNVHFGTDAPPPEPVMENMIQQALIASRIDNIMVLQAISPELCAQHVTDDLPWFLQEALNGDPFEKIEKRLNDIRSLLNSSIHNHPLLHLGGEDSDQDSDDGNGSVKKAVRAEMDRLLDDFPIGNMPIEKGYPFLHTAFARRAVWALECVPRGCDPYLVVQGTSPFDFLPVIPRQSERDIESLLRGFSIKKVLGSLTPNFAKIVKTRGGCEELLTVLSRVAHKSPNPAILHALIQAGANSADVAHVLAEQPSWVDALDSDRCTPLMRAVEVSNLDVGHLLLRKIAPSSNHSLETVNHKGDGVMHILLHQKSTSKSVHRFAFALIENNPRILRIANIKRETPLVLAAKYGHIDLLLAFHSACPPSCVEKECALHAAAAGNQPSVLHHLCKVIRTPHNTRVSVASKRVIQHTSSIGDTPLHTAGRFCSVEAFVELVHLGADPASENDNKESAIELAFVSGADNDKLVTFLLSLPAVLNAEPSKANAYFVACCKGSKATVKTLAALLNMGFSPNAHDSHNVSALIWSVMVDNADAVQLLLQHGASPQQLAHTNQSFLHFSVVAGTCNALRVALNWCVEHCSSSELLRLVNLVDKEGNTALHDAARQNNSSCVAVLLSCGCDAALNNHAGLTPGQVAIGYHCGDALSVIRDVLPDQYQRDVTHPIDEYPMELRSKVAAFLQNSINVFHPTPTMSHDSIATAWQRREDALSLDRTSSTSPTTQRPPPSIENEKLEETLRGVIDARLSTVAYVVQRCSAFPLLILKVTLVLTTENKEENPALFNAMVQLLELAQAGRFPLNIMKDTIPFLAEESLPKLVALVSALSSMQSASIWEWFSVYFTPTCIQVSSQPSVALFSEFTELVTRFVDDLPRPTLPSLSGFAGKRSSFYLVVAALKKARCVQDQVALINRVPLQMEALIELEQLQCQFFVSSAALAAAQGSVIIPSTLSSSSTFFASTTKCAIALKAMQSGKPALLQCEFDVDEHAAPEITKKVLDVILRMGAEDTHYARAWCAAATMIHQQCGDEVLDLLCGKIIPMKAVLHICSVIARLNNVSGVPGALTTTSGSVVHKIEELLSKETVEKDMDTILRELATPLQRSAVDGTFKAHEFPFGGTPIVCLENDEIEALRTVGKTIRSFKPPSTQSEIREMCVSLGAQMKGSPSLETVGECIALLSRAFEIVFKMKPYLIQQLTVTALVLVEVLPSRAERLKGRIAQVATGEGKSLNVCLFASLCAIQGRCVDVITSTPYLARRDFKKFAPFFDFIGVSSNTVSVDPHPTQTHFNATVLYGTNTDFEFTILREGVRSSDIQTMDSPSGRVVRVPNTIISDESDNLFLDKALSAARLGWEGADNAQWVFAPILEFVTLRPFASSWDLRPFLLEYCGGKYRKAVSTFTSERLERWISSANLSLQKQKNHHYVVDRNDETNELEVQIMELGTGRRQIGTRWQHGLHEFIEVREGIVPKSEGSTIASISHPAFFKRYKHVYGLTGTAGEPIEREEIETTYGIDSFDVPPHQKCLRRRLPTRVCCHRSTCHEVLIDTIEKTKDQGRPILLLFLTIEDSVEFSNILKNVGIAHNVLNEMQREDEEWLVFKAGQPRSVTIATNTAGRGTDIVLSRNVRNNGGLHVVFTFFPENFRVECQGLGRAGRQGDPGSAQIITHRDDRFVNELLGTMPSYLDEDGDAEYEPEEVVESLYVARSESVTAVSNYRKRMCTIETQLFDTLQKFFAALAEFETLCRSDSHFAMLVEQQIFASSGVRTPATIYFQRVAHLLKSEWAFCFTDMSNSRDDLSTETLDAMFSSYYEEYFRDVLQGDRQAAASALVELMAERN